ncbi:hypothetical protein C8J57DRAFT_1465819 [Mycena rebaudengoi]|nr:hypothetical protein C8J57DRAFT_1465819 [Mycena rebaudengoi]
MPQLCTSLLIHAPMIRAGQLVELFSISGCDVAAAKNIQTKLNYFGRGTTSTVNRQAISEHTESERRRRQSAHLARYPARDGAEERGDALAVQEGPWHGDGCEEGCAPHSGGDSCVLHEVDGGSARVGRGALVSGSGVAALHDGQDGAAVRRAHTPHIEFGEGAPHERRSGKRSGGRREDDSGGVAGVRRRGIPML